MKLIQCSTGIGSTTFFKSCPAGAESIRRLLFGVKRINPTMPNPNPMKSKPNLLKGVNLYQHKPMNPTHRSGGIYSKSYHYRMRIKEIKFDRGTDSDHFLVLSSFPLFMK